MERRNEPNRETLKYTAQLRAAKKKELRSVTR